MKELSRKQLEKITESVVFNYLAMVYNEEVKHTSAYKHQLKRDLNKVIKTLEDAESKAFDRIFDISEDTATFVDSISGSIIDMITNLRTKAPEMSIFMKSNILNAYAKDPKRIEGIATKILNQ